MLIMNPSGMLHVCLNLFLRSTIRIEKRYTANIPRDGRFILASNHRTYLDPFIINLALRRPVRWIGASFLDDIPIVRSISKMAGTMLVSAMGNATFRSIAHIFVQSAREPHIGIFPEGYAPLVELKPSYPLGAFHRGFAYIARKMHKPVLPVTILPVREKVRPYPLPVTIRKMLIPHSDLCELEERTVYKEVVIVFHPPMAPPRETASRLELAVFSESVREVISAPLRNGFAKGRTAGVEELRFPDGFATDPEHPRLQWSPRG